MSSDLEFFFYHSHLSEDYDATCVGAIIRTARVFNEQHEITGILVFDGEQFCQYIEGPRESIRGLIGRLEADARHTRFTPLLHQPLTGPRLYPNWTMAYALLDDLAFVNHLRQQPPPAALAYLGQESHRLDMH